MQWFYRNGAEPGTTTMLVDAVRALAWADARPYVWGAGESRAMTAVRKYLRYERRLPRSSVLTVAYWRQAHTAAVLGED